mmetsp:Transcript_50141/g.92567  ORF Transcript_50141/g.92567 Transcript_50141/m.92567 type:complete len:333 (+) Transcript_50141:37-1035(+)
MRHDSRRFCSKALSLILGACVLCHQCRFSLLSPLAMAAIPAITLPDGRSMQKMAVGLYNVPRDKVASTLEAALNAGCRHFDSASFYDNEVEVGQFLRSWLEKHDRSEIFLTTKVWTTDLVSPEAAVRSASISIEELGLGPVDMVMVHWPTPGKHIDAYVGLEALVKEGKSKSLGLSNYSPEDYEELMKVASIAPLANTFENNPMLYRKGWVDYFQEKGVVVQAYKPLQRSGPVLSSDAVTAIASRVGKSPAQVCLKWNVQKGNVVVFKTLSEKRLEENVNIFDFELSKEDMAELDALTTEESIATAKKHWETRRSGTPGPWGDCPRPDRRTA